MPLQTIHRPQTLEDLYGNTHIKDSLEAVLGRTKDKPHSFLITGDSGCVDKDTEFFTSEGWKPISKYKKGDLVLQYNHDGSAEFVRPLKYIKIKCDELTLMKSKYGVNQCLCDEHRVVYLMKGKLLEKSFSEVKKQHEKNKMGFKGLFKTTFVPKIHTELPLTDDELKIQIMVMADSHIPDKKKKCCVSLKKERKILRAEKLLKNANISYEKYHTSGYTRFNFIPPMREKHFSHIFYACSAGQLKIIADEILNWDGSEKYQQYFSTHKEDVDFIQYVFASVDKRATIYKDTRTGKECYTLSIAHNKNVSIMGESRKDSKLSSYKTKDGFKYCFNVPSSYLVLRREGNIFITGNCGKTTIGHIIKNMVECAPSDFYYYNAANARGIDTIREISEGCQYPPMFGKSKVYMLDEAHMVTKSAGEAALLLLEEPPQYCYFILCTTEPEQLKDTLKRRCHHYNVMPLKRTEMMEMLNDVLKKEKVKAFSNTVLTQIAKVSNGSPGKALKFLDMVIDLTDDETAMKLLSAESGESESIELSRLMIDFSNTPSVRWNEAKDVLSRLEADPETTRFKILAYMNKCLLGKGNPAPFVAIIANFLDSFSYSGKAGLSLAVYASIHNI